eukprot:m.335923 g.335923  ORF g.335923 m.335923 type:complete len:131 (+) comp20528_c0_seq5:142-534(+)
MICAWSFGMYLSFVSKGEAKRCEDSYKKAVDDRLHQSFVNIQPAGKELSRSVLVNGIRNGYGTSPEFRITIKDFKLRWSTDTHALATYVEVQTGARNSAATNARISSLLFEVQDDGISWIHLQETGIAVE